MLAAIRLIVRVCRFGEPSRCLYCRQPLPTVHTRDPSQGTVSLGEVPEPVVLAIAAEPDGSRDEIRPGILARTPRFALFDQIVKTF